MGNSRTGTESFLKKPCFYNYPNYGKESLISSNGIFPNKKHNLAGSALPGKSK